jgi:hypothetical protein
MSAKESGKQQAKKEKRKTDQRMFEFDEFLR